jgi:hypothetical protein
MFYTPVTLHPLQGKIQLQDPIITAGSCFADCMGGKFQENKFKILANPFGTIYNPISLHKQYLKTMNNSGVDEGNIIKNQGLYFHYNFHSQFAGETREELVETLNKKISQAHEMLKSARWFIITWGTAWIYQLEDTNDVVANCHKQPQNNFKKTLLDNKDIIEDFKNFYAALKKFNPDIQIILTISPVRHIKDTLSMNMVSKSILRVAAHLLSDEYNDIHYFPAYEIMMDELRDYRFYKEDMIHPTSQAEDYIWEKFKGVSIDKDTNDFIQQWQEIHKALAHKPFNASSEAHQKFLQKIIQKLEQMNDKVDVKDELEKLRSQLL